MLEPKVYIITLNWNGAAETINCLESLLGLDYSNYELLACDNASRPESLAALKKWGADRQSSETSARPFLIELAASAGTAVQGPTKAARVTLIHTGGNLGFAGGMNAGVRYAQAHGDADYVWLLNNDTVVQPDCLRELVLRAGSDSSIGICGSTLIDFDARERVQAFGGAQYTPWSGRSRALGAFGHLSTVPADPAGVEAQMSYVVGASMLVSRQYLAEVGLMDESYFLYSEEHDWAYRGIQKNFRLGYAPRSLVYHMHGATIGTSPSGGSNLSLFYLYRGKAMFAARFHPWLMPVVCGFFMWDATKLLLKRQPRKAWALIRGVFAWPTRRTYY